MCLTQYGLSAIDERMVDALDTTAIDAIDLPEGFEERIRLVVREELHDQ
jgi:membrane-bound lytic murein transglycosylase B